MANKVYQQIATLVSAIHNCEKSGNAEWLEKHTDKLRMIERQLLPSGSGFNSGCIIDLTKSNEQKIVIECPFHEMNENGYYIGWSELRAEVMADLQFNFTVAIKGRSLVNDKEYQVQTMHEALDASVPEDFFIKEN